jgi:Crp-like helix-turn-helix domain
MEDDRFELAQESLAQILCVARSAVTAIAGTLQQAELTRYRRDEVTVLDRRGLEAPACESATVVTDCRRPAATSHESLINARRPRHRRLHRRLGKTTGAPGHRGTDARPANGPPRAGSPGALTPHTTSRPPPQQSAVTALCIDALYVIVGLRRVVLA